MEDKKSESVVLEVQNIVQETKTGIDQNATCRDATPARQESKKGGEKSWEK